MSNTTRRRFLTVSGVALGGITTGATVTAAERTDRFIVESRGRTSRRDLERAGLTVVHDLSEIGYYVLEGAETSVRRIAGDYAPDVEVAIDPAIDRVDVGDDSLDVSTPGSQGASGQSATDEPYYGFQWDKQVQNVPTAHETTRGEGALVTVIDSGVAAGHPDLAHAVDETRSRNFTGDGQGSANPAGGYHGTHVAGILAADDRNDAGVVGTAPGASIVDCRVFSATATTTFGDILAAIVYSANIDADVANLSLGAYPISRRGLGAFYGRVVNRATTYANNAGTLLTVAAGNASADLQHDGAFISLPAEAAQAVGVSATGPLGFAHGPSGLEEPADSPAIYTNYGTNAIDLSAPGGDYDPTFPAGWYYDVVLNAIAVPSFDANGNYTGATYDYSWVAGTSMAAPQVAGAAALLASEAPALSANQLRNVLERTAAAGTGGKEYHGSGFVDPVSALDAL